MRNITRLFAATSLGIGGLMLVGCEANQSGGGGGYHSTSSEENVGSRSSHGLYGGTTDQTGSAGGGTSGNYLPSTTATPYSNATTPSNGPTPASNVPPAAGSGTTPDRYNGGVPTGTNPGGG